MRPGPALALAAAGVLSLAAAKAPADKPLTAPKIVSGTPQAERAYAAPTTSQYLASFPKPLVVSVSGLVEGMKVQFICPAPHCKLKVDDEDSDPGKRVNAATYDEVIKNNQATLKMALATDVPGHYVVFARMVDSAAGTLGPNSAPFELWLQ